MIDSVISTLKKPRRLSSLLGLTLDGSRLEGVVLRRTNGSVQVQQSFSVLLSLDPLTAPADLVGREILNHLSAAGVRERACIVGLPVKWVLTAHADVPPLPPADVESFLALEAERGFPCDASTLQIATSRCSLAGDRSYALLAGIARSQVLALDRALRAARLRPISFSLGLAALQPPGGPSAPGTLALAIGESQVGLQITCGGGIAALRALEGAMEIEGPRRSLRADAVAREIRITLGQLPPDARDQVRRLRIFGPSDLAQSLADELELRLESLGLAIEAVAAYEPDEFGGLAVPPGPVWVALSLAAGKLAGRPSAFEFLPPRITAWRRLSARYSSGKLRLAGAAATAALAIVAGLFLLQQWRLTRLSSQWNAMAAQARELENIRQQIQTYRPWYDEHVRGLAILKALAQAFPEDGVVWAKTVEIRDLSLVTCAGQARDYQALLKTLDRLRAADGVSAVRLSTIRGKTPMQFTFDFRYLEGGRSAN